MNPSGWNFQLVEEVEVVLSCSAFPVSTSYLPGHHLGCIGLEKNQYAGGLVTWWISKKVKAMLLIYQSIEKFGGEDLEYSDGESPCLLTHSHMSIDEHLYPLFQLGCPHVYWLFFGVSVLFLLRSFCLSEKTAFIHYVLFFFSYLEVVDNNENDSLIPVILSLWRECGVGIHGRIAERKGVLNLKNLWRVQLLV